MTTLSELQPGMQFLMACQVVSVDANGMTLALFGSATDAAAEGVIGLTGGITGQLLTTPDQVPVNILTGLVPLTVGDVLTNDVSGETMVCRWSQITPDGDAVWSSSGDHQVVYASSGWTVVGHVDL